jgi:predicted NBD/HSP70 family sugar kinase
MDNGVSHKYTRDTNLRLILRAIKNHGPLSRADLARLIRLTPPTVSALVSMLVESHLVIETEKDKRKRGRPSQMIEFNEHTGCVIALDITYTAITVCFATLGGTPLLIMQEPRNRFAVVGETIDQCIDLVNRSSSKAKIPLTSISSLSISIPGIVNSLTGEVVLSKNMLGWHHVPLGELIEVALGIPVYVENDIRCAALGEYAYGVARGYGTFVYIGLCGGIGSAIMMDGVLIHGSQFLAGEIGFMNTHLESTGGLDTESHYLENIIGLGVIRDRVLQEIRMGRKTTLCVVSPGEEDRATLGHILAGAREKDSLAVEITDQIARGLAYAVTNLSVMFDPELIVLGPNYGQGEEFLLEKVRKLVDQQFQFHRNIVLCELDPHKEALGALYIACEKAIERYISGDIGIESQVADPTDH